MPVRPRSLPVTTAAQAASRDRAAIAAGTASFDLMLRAGTATASVIVRELSHRLANGVAIFAGPGNNGGDAYVVAAQLARAGIRVRLHASEPPRTDDAQRAAGLAESALLHGAPTGSEQVVIDGLLGTGQTGALREQVALACERIALLRDSGAVVVALDIPTGVDATTGDIANGAVVADVTTAYGTFKRGHVIARAQVGRVILCDIGLDGHADCDDGAWLLAEHTTLSSHVPAIAWNTWKTKRGVVGIIGGATGMAGAVMLAARASLASGAGLTHAIVSAQSALAIQASVPQALVHDRATFDIDRFPFHALGVGPGLGRDAEARALLEQSMTLTTPLVLDADALTLIALSAQESSRNAADIIADAVHDSRSIVCTPHAGEFARLTGVPQLPDALGERVEAATSFAISSRSTVLLKGTPTIICSNDGAPPMVVARGTAMLATGGSGDLLTGIITTLLAQGVPGPHAAALGAWIHGRSAELASGASRTVRGLMLDDVIAAMPHAWRELERPASFQAYVLSELPAVIP